MAAKLIWITGLAGSGKTTIGRMVHSELKKTFNNTVFLDGDTYREITGQTSSHTKEERLQVAMQIARMCKFLTSQDINVVCSTISLFKEVHLFNRDHNENYFEIFIDTDIDELVKRDQKGLYSRAIKGEVKNVVGVDMPFDKPEKCHLHLKNNTSDELNNNVEKIINLINIK
jgi:adenylylsulfate kinase-like enzyme